MKAGITNLQLACSRLAALARCGRRCSGSGIFDRGRHEEEEISSDATDVAGRSKHDRYFRKDMFGRAVSAAGTRF